MRAVDPLVKEIRTTRLERCAEIILVGDGNPPGLSRQIDEDIAALNAPFVRHVAMPVNLGPAAARNEGVCQSRGRILVFLDDDLVPGEGYIRQTKKVHEDRPDILALSGNLRSMRNDIYSRFWFHYSRISHMTQAKSDAKRFGQGD